MEVALIYLIVCLPLAAIAGRLAETRGRNFWVFFVFCALFPIAAVVAIPYLLVRRRTA